MPRVLGWNAINLYELGLQSDGYYERYDDRCNPTILNEFATAAFRFGHSLLKPSFKRMDDRYVNRVSSSTSSGRTGTRNLGIGYPQYTVRTPLVRTLLVRISL